MNLRKIMAALVQSVGVIIVALGLSFAAAFALPYRGTGSPGLYRWTQGGRTLLVYNTGNTYYMMSMGHVAAAAAVFILIGGTFVLAGERYRHAPAAH